MTKAIDAFKARAMNYLDLIFNLSKRQISQNYKDSLLGFVWILMHPVLMISIYTLIFSNVFAAKIAHLSGEISYALYICIGIVFWSYFNETVLGCIGAISSHANLIKKIKFPIMIAFASSIATSSFNFIVLLSVFAVFFVYSGGNVGIGVLNIFLVLIVQVALASGVGILFGLLGVFFRDASELIKIIMQLWFWSTPIVYPVTILPDRLKGFMEWNPFYAIITSYHDILFGRSFVNWSGLAYPFYIAAVILVLILVIIHRLRSEILDEL